MGKLKYSIVALSLINLLGCNSESLKTNLDDVSSSTSSGGECICNCKVPVCPELNTTKPPVSLLQPIGVYVSEQGAYGAGATFRGHEVIKNFWILTADQERDILAPKYDGWMSVIKPDAHYTTTWGTTGNKLTYGGRPDAIVKVLWISDANNSNSCYNVQIVRYGNKKKYGRLCRYQIIYKVPPTPSDYSEYN